VNDATRAILVEMKERLSVGWTQGDLQRGDGVCLFGALIYSKTAGTSVKACPRDEKIDGVRGRSGDGANYRMVMGEADTPNETPLGQAIRLLAAEAGVPMLDLARWNDAEGRTHEEVVGLIDAVLMKDTQRVDLAAELRQIDDAAGDVDEDELVDLLNAPEDPVVEEIKRWRRLSLRR